MITLTEAATLKLQHLLHEKGLTGHGLRVFVQGGGCAGYQYGMAFESQAEDGDEVFEHGEVKVYIDPLSLMYLDGSEIDYVDNLMGGGFAIHNPNAVATCGCGHSFRTASGAGQGSASGCH